MPRLPSVDGDFVLTDDLVQTYLRDYQTREATLLELKQQYDALKKDLNEFRNDFTKNEKLHTPPVERAIKFARSHTPRQCRDELVAMWMTFKALGKFDQGDLFPSIFEEGGAQAASKAAA